MLKRFVVLSSKKGLRGNCFSGINCTLMHLERERQAREACAMLRLWGHRTRKSEAQFIQPRVPGPMELQGYHVTSN